MIAHRGWSSGPGENTLAAFRRAASDPRVSGVEFDLRRAADGSLVVAHDPPDPEATSLDEVIRFISETRLDAYVEVKEPGIDREAAGRLAAGGLSDRAVIFGPAEVLERSNGAREVRLGIMEPYPWRIPRLVAAFRPDVILLGWDERVWTRLTFRAWWSVFPLRSMGRQYATAVVVGVVRRAGDLRWLRRRGIDAAVVDMAEF